MYLLLFFVSLCKADFLVYYNTNIFVNNTNNCSGEFIIMYDINNKTFTSDTMIITFNDTGANISVINETDRYTFIFGINEHISNYIYDMISMLLIYKNDVLVGKSIVSENNTIIILTATDQILYYINQINDESNCRPSNVYSYFNTVTHNNTIIPENIIAAGIGSILPDVWISKHNIGYIVLFVIVCFYSILLGVLLFGGCDRIRRNYCFIKN